MIELLAGDRMYMELIVYFFYNILQGTDVYNYVRTELNVSVGT